MRNILKNKKIIMTVIGALVILILLTSSFTTIKSGEVGIRVRFGKVVNKSTHEGVNFKIPVIERIEKMNVRVQKSEVKTTSSSKDLQEVDMSLAVNYRIDNKKAIELYKTVGTNYKEVILEPAIQESIKATTSKYTAEELITKRSEVSTKSMEELSKKVEKYGLSISDFNITNFSFSAEFDKAIEEKQVAEQKVLTAKQELEKEKSLTDNSNKEKFIEKWDGVLPKVTGSNSIFDISGILD